MVTYGNMLGQFTLAWVSKGCIIHSERCDIHWVQKKIKDLGPTLKHHLGKGPVAALRGLGFMDNLKMCPSTKLWVKRQTCYPNLELDLDPMEHSGQCD